MWNAISPGFELVSPCPIPATITITPWAPPYWIWQRPLEVEYDLSFPVVESHLVGHCTSGRFYWVCLGTGEFLWPQGAIPQGFTPFGGVYYQAPEVPLIREMPMGPKVFLALPDAYGLRPCYRTHLKNRLVPHSCVGGTYDK